MGLGSFRISVRARCRAVPFGRRRHTTQFQATTDKPGLLMQLLDVIREIDCDWTPHCKRFHQFRGAQISGKKDGADRRESDETVQ